MVEDQQVRKLMKLLQGEKTLSLAACTSPKVISPSNRCYPGLAERLHLRAISGLER